MDGSSIFEQAIGYCLQIFFTRLPAYPISPQNGSAERISTDSGRKGMLPHSAVVAGSRTGHLWTLGDLSLHHSRGGKQGL